MRQYEAEAEAEKADRMKTKSYMEEMRMKGKLEEE